MRLYKKYINLLRLFIVHLAEKQIIYSVNIEDLTDIKYNTHKKYFSKIRIRSANSSCTSHCHTSW